MFFVFLYCLQTWLVVQSDPRRRRPDTAECFGPIGFSALWHLVRSVYYYCIMWQHSWRVNHKQMSHPRHVWFCLWNPGWMLRQSKLLFMHFSHLSWAQMHILISSQIMCIKHFSLSDTFTLILSLLCGFFFSPKHWNVLGLSQIGHWEKEGL